MAAAPRPGRSGSPRARWSPPARTDAARARPLRLVGTTLYLDRYWREERQVAADLLRARRRAPADADRRPCSRAGLARLFRDGRTSASSSAAAAAVLRRFAVVAGGPGTGKTTTVARIVALLAEQAADQPGAREPLVALAAPTGKAAARLEEAVHDEAATLDVGRTRCARSCSPTSASTLHRLLGWRPDSHSRFRHHRGNRLPHDVVVVDETSMVSLSLMARLVEAVRPGARLILVGDPGQLTSIEAGAVLGDIVGPASEGPRMRPPRARDAGRGRPATAGSTVACAIGADRAGRDALRRRASSCSTACTASAKASPPWPPRSAAATPTRRSPRSTPRPRT